MILRMDRLLVELPQPKNPSPNAAAAIQELLGGKYGEMSMFPEVLATGHGFPMRGPTMRRGCSSGGRWAGISFGSSVTSAHCPVTRPGYCALAPSGHGWITTLMHPSFSSRVLGVG